MEPPSVADLVDHLFKTRRRPDGKEYTYQEVTAALDGQLDPSYIGKLRSGKIRNPGRHALLLLCQFFRVPASYFFPELEALAPLEEEHAEEDQIQIALRSARLPPDVQGYLEGLIRAFRQQQKEKEE